MASRWPLAVLLLVASDAALRSPHYSLRERPPSYCGFAHYGSTAGSAQRLVETHLAPGVADWNIVIPMPPPCAQAQVTGADMRVCDADAPPAVTMSDARSARVHRVGQLAGFATVNVTVYCILPPAPPPPRPSPPQLSPPPPPPIPPPPPLPAPPPPRLSLPAPPPPTTTSIALPLSDLTDSRSTYEMLSNELSSKELTSHEETSDESESSDLKSIELTTTVKPTSSSTVPPTQEQTTAQVELTPPTDVLTAPSNNVTRPKEKAPHSLKVTINIAPTNQVSTEEDESQAYTVELPSISNKEKPDEPILSHSPRLSSVPYIMTPPRIATMPPKKLVKQPRDPGSSAHLPPRAYPNPDVYQPQPQPQPRFQPPHYVSGPQYSAMPSPYDLMPPYSLAPAYRPFSLLSPRLTFLQRRQPLLFFRHF